MRATLAGLYGKIKTLEDKEDDIFNKWLSALEQDRITNFFIGANNSDKKGSQSSIVKKMINQDKNKNNKNISKRAILTKFLNEG